ncbi:hypothetical protein TWF788_002412 [Orbilia oligospora]|uniref:FAS1 domain-containing protein n=1 Tax=Orbilia oligospora TaxID=2813651 RepID=A0A7C8PJW8_ORBOL|nr:hypothetical protein TWF788_002412 [Orbilia oligospora]
MMFPKLLSPSKTALLLVAILSATRPSVSAPTADVGTAVSSAPKPVPNVAPSKAQSLHRRAEIPSSTLRTKDGIPNPPPKRLGKRQLQQMSVSAPAILSRPPNSPNTNDEENAIGAAAERIKQAADEAVNHMEEVANSAVRNAANEQRDGVDNPNFHGSQDDSYIWPSAVPSYYPWPTNVATTWDPLASAAAVAAAAPGGQEFQVLDGNGNPAGDNQILNEIGQTIPGQTLQNSDPSVVSAITSNLGLWLQVLDDPNIQKFLQDNTPEGLQPLLDPSTVDKLEQNPGLANNLVPSLNNPTPESITPFLVLLDTVSLTDKLNLVNEGHDVALLAQTDPEELARMIDTVNNLSAPNQFPVSDFRTDILPPPTVHTDTGSMLFTTNGFEMRPVGPFGGPAPLPQQDFDGTISQPPGPVSDIFRGTLGAIPTNVFLPNGGTISFNCVPIYIDADGEEHAASDIPPQILSAFNVGGMQMPITTQSSFMDQTTDPNTPLTPFLSEVVAENPDILSASQIDDTTVLVNTEGGDDAEKVFLKLQNGWGLQAESTDKQNGLGTVTLKNGGTKFQISQPQGFATADILDAKTPGDILNKIGEGASIQLETANVAPVPEVAA